jgi:protein-S-isoprenylcysteine O-methyltransferase Ste14
MNAILAAAYGLACYVFFLATFLYAIGFVGNVFVPKAIDTGPAAPLTEALLVNTLLLAIFAIQHSVMARPAFKRWWTRLVPKPVERSTYVLFASAALALLLWQWRPLPDLLWNVQDRVAVAALQAVFWLGWGVLLASTFLINHFELFGLQQVFSTRKAPPAQAFRTPGFYRYVRHPIYLGFLLAFWATPAMSVGHLLFAIATTGYILIGIALEERDLIDQFGDAYRRYREQVGMLIPRAAPRPPQSRTPGHPRADERSPSR